jgi:hypothetical protein
MPKVADAAVLAVGTIVNLENSTDFETKEVDGVRVLVATGDGFASVKLKLDVASELKPVSGQAVAWYLRYGATGGGDRGAASYSTFVRVANPSDLDRLAGIVRKG